jgi:hypothetical protein
MDIFDRIFLSQYKARKAEHNEQFEDFIHGPERMQS